MSSYAKKIQNSNNKINKNLINDQLSSIISNIIEDETYQEGKNKIIELFRFYISDDKVINLCLTIINNIIILKGNSKYKILSTIPEICQIEPKSFFNHLDIILSIFQSCLTDDNSPYYSQISQYFGDIVKVLLAELNSENYNTYIINSDNHQNMKNNLSKQKDLFLVYTKFKLFCLSNIKSNNTGCQICGTLCLTSFIENCSFNYTNNENLKCIFDNLCEQINNPNFPGKLEILNCFISLVFCSEEKYVPYSILTLNIIIKYINDQEWLIRKFSLNIIYTMLYYCKKEIIEKKDFILEKINSLKYESNIEVKEIADQINKMINEEESTNISYNNKIAFLSDSLLDSNNSKFSSGEQSKKNFINNYSINNNQFKISEEEKNEGKENKKNIANTNPGISKKKLKNSFIKKNNKIKIEKNQMKSKSDQKRKNINKYNDAMINIDNSSSKKLFSKQLNNSSLNQNKENIENHFNRKRNDVLSDNLPNKTRNKKIPQSRNSVDRYYDIQKKNQISMILKKRNILKNNNNNIKTEAQNIKIKPKVKNLDYHSSEKSKKIIIGLRQKPNNFQNLSNKKNNKKYKIDNNINKNSMINNIKPNNTKYQQNIIGRNEIFNPINYISNTTININNNPGNNKNVLKLNKIPSFGPRSDEDNNPLYSNENSEYIEDIKTKLKNYENKNIAVKNKLNELKKHSKHNYSFENKKLYSKNNFLNRSLENNILNYSGSNRFNEEKVYENKLKIRKPNGNIKNNNIKNNYNKNKSIEKFNPLLKKYNNEKINAKNRYNNSQRNNNKVKRITKLNKPKKNDELQNNSINNRNNYEKDSKIYQMDYNSPGSQLKDSLELYNLFHSFSNNENEYENKDNKIDKKHENKSFKNESKKITHKANHSYQIQKNSKNNKLKNMYIERNSKLIKNKKIQIQRKSNNNNNKIDKENKNINNEEIEINNIALNIKDDKIIMEPSFNDLDYQQVSEIENKKDEPIEVKFKEYKNETSKIINDLKLQVNYLKTTLGSFEETTKQKDKLYNEVKNGNYSQAFETAIEIGNIQDIYYVIKKYQLSSENKNIPVDVLGGIMKILCEDILSCENLRLIQIFIIKNICDKNIVFEKELNKEIYNVFSDLYNKKKELCFMKKDITNILKISNYFSISK